MDWDRYLPAILGIVVALTTGLLALTGVWLANRNNQRQLDQRLRHEAVEAKREVLRGRLEELYSLVSSWSNDVVTHHIMYQRVMVGELSYNQALDLTISSKKTGDANRLFTLAELYFPATREALENLKQLRDEAAAIQSSFKREYKQGNTASAKHADALIAVLDRFNSAVHDYQGILAAYAADVDPSK